MLLSVLCPKAGISSWGTVAKIIKICPKLSLPFVQCKIILTRPKNLDLGPKLFYGKFCLHIFLDKNTPKRPLWNTLFGWLIVHSHTLLIGVWNLPDIWHHVQINILTIGRKNWQKTLTPSPRIRIKVNICLFGLWNVETSMPNILFF